MGLNNHSVKAIGFAAKQTLKHLEPSYGNIKTIGFAAKQMKIQQGIDKYDDKREKFPKQNTKIEIIIPYNGQERLKKQLKHEINSIKRSQKKINRNLDSIIIRITAVNSGLLMKELKVESEKYSGCMELDATKSNETVDAPTHYADLDGDGNKGELK